MLFMLFFRQALRVSDFYGPIWPNEVRLTPVFRSIRYQRRTAQVIYRDGHDIYEVFAGVVELRSFELHSLALLFMCSFYSLDMFSVF